eukprot:TRINITY_DN40253_c0_g1_i1.p1 TRINITY_DN40253_c0_g1~~TRINITY_DN40253_c0_g1_i1.p1  ORF type:complete len:500 (+),score=216.46 TRINITY_DN40253_c0_g1_i1:69-1502(+)
MPFEGGPGGPSGIRQLEEDIDRHLQWFREQVNGPAPHNLSGPDMPSPVDVDPEQKVPTLSAPPVGGIPDTRGVIAAVMEELQRMLADEFGQYQRKQEQQLKAFIEQEWGRKLSVLEYVAKERHDEMRKMFDHNSKVALHIGNKMLSANQSIDELLGGAEQQTEWRKAATEQLRVLQKDVRDLQARSEEAERRTQEALRERDAFRRQALEVERIRDDIVQRASRIDDEAERRLRPRIEELTSQVERLTKELRTTSMDLTDLKQRHHERSEQLDSTLRQLSRDITRTRAKLSKHADEVQEAHNATAELFDLVSKAESPGYCSGCRLVRDECDRKMFTVKESICYLNDRVQAMRGGGDPAAEPTSPAAGTAVPELDRRVSVLEQRVSDVRADAVTAARQAAQEAAAAAAPQSSGFAEPPGHDDLVRRVSMDVQAALVQPIGNKIEMEVTTFKAEVSALEDKVNEFNSWATDRIGRLEDRL